VGHALRRCAAEVRGIQGLNRGQIADVPRFVVKDIQCAREFRCIAGHQLAGHFYVQARLIEAALIAQLDRIVKNDARHRRVTFPAGSDGFEKSKLIWREPGDPIIADGSASREKGPNH